jgi:hypothetical protein
VKAFRRLVRYLLVPALLWFAGTTYLEWRRLWTVLPRDTPAAPELSSATLRADLEALASPDMEGRRTGMPGGLKARAYVERRFQEIGLEPLPGGGFARPFRFTHTSIRALWRRDRPFRMEFADAANVVGLLPAANPAARLIVVSAHYDHLGVRKGVLYPGADDDASGVAAILAIATWAKTHPLRHGLVFVAFDAEELGLRGSKALLADPAFPRGRVDVDLSLDMVSRPEGGGLAVAGTGPRPELRPLVEAAARHASIPVRLGHDRPQWRAGLVDDWTEGSDHGSFADAGIPWLYLGVEDHDDYHEPGDTPDKISKDYHAGAAEFALALLKELDRR